MIRIWPSGEELTTGGAPPPALEEADLAVVGRALWAAGVLAVGLASPLLAVASEDLPSAAPVVVEDAGGWTPPAVAVGPLAIPLVWVDAEIPASGPLVEDDAASVGGTWLLRWAWLDFGSAEDLVSAAAPAVVGEEDPVGLGTPPALRWTGWETAPADELPTGAAPIALEEDLGPGGPARPPAPLGLLPAGEDEIPAPTGVLDEETRPAVWSGPTVAWPALPMAADELASWRPMVEAEAWAASPWTRTPGGGAVVHAAEEGASLSIPLYTLLGVVVIDRSVPAFDLRDRSAPSVTLTPAESPTLTLADVSRAAVTLHDRSQPGFALTDRSNT